MRAFAFASAISLATASAAEAAPKRVASLNLCTDELLLLLARPEQILSVTHLSHQQAESPLWRQARQYPRNDGALLSVAALRPDLVLGMGGGGRSRVDIAARLRIRALDLPFAQTLVDVEESITTVAAAVGRPEAGKRLLNQMRALRRTAPRARADAIWLGGGGRSLSAVGLGAEWLALAGFAQRPLPGNRASLEELLLKPPQVLVRSDYRTGQFSSEQRWLSHRLAHGAGKTRTIGTDGRAWTCMGPLLIPEIVKLRKAAP